MIFIFFVYIFALLNNEINVGIIEGEDCVIALNMREMKDGDIYFRGCWLDLLHDFDKSVCECFD